MARVALFAAAVLFLPMPALAQAWPAKPVRVILPQPAGQGPSDISTRLITQELSRALGQPLVVENRPGANGVIGMEALSKAVPDGYTIAVTSASVITLTPITMAKLPYDPQKAYVPVINFGASNSAIVVNTSLPVNSVRDLIALARAKPESLAWGTFSSSSLYVAWLKNVRGVPLYEIPYKTATQTLLGAVAGDVQIAYFAINGVVPQVKAGKVRALAVTGEQRSPFLPDVPTFREAGLEFDIPAWYGMFAVAGTPRDIVMKLNAETHKVLMEPKMKEQLLERAAIDATGGSPEQFAAVIARDREVFQTLVKAAGLKAE